MERRRSPDHECRRCSLCPDGPHCWLLQSTEPVCANNTPQVREIAGEAALIWACRHCPAWMEVMPEDDGDGPAEGAWEDAAIVR